MEETISLKNTIFLSFLIFLTSMSLKLLKVKDILISFGGCLFISGISFHLENNITEDSFTVYLLYYCKLFPLRAPLGAPLG